MNIFAAGSARIKNFELYVLRSLKITIREKINKAGLTPIFAVGST